MKTNSKIADRKKSILFATQLLCLLIVGFMEFLLITQGKPIYTELYRRMLHGIGGSIVVFWGVSLWRGPHRFLWRDVCLGFVMVIWFLLLKLLRCDDDTTSQQVLLFLAVYLIVFPFAAVTEDDYQQAGIHTAAGVFLLGAAYLMAWVLVLLTEGETSELTQRLVFWREGRLNVIHHPNTLARIFMIAICLSLGFLEKTKERFTRGLLLLFAGMLFAAMALTNSRACILVTSLMLGGNVFFWIRKGGRKDLLPAFAAAAVVIIVSFLIANGLFRWLSNRLMNPIGDAQTVVHTHQGSWSTDLPSLNNRTQIWAGALQKIQNDPRILLWGTTDTKIDVGFFVASHSHNAWMETLLRLGAPGLLMSLIFSWQAGLASLQVLRHFEAGLWKKNIAMLVLAMMVTSMLEPFLFVTNVIFHFFDYFFFLCLGYLTLWSRQLKKQC